MREAFKTALGEDFLARGGCEILSKAQVEVSEDASAPLLDCLHQAAEQADVDDLIREAFRRALREASVSPVGANGKPRMLKLTAWIAHAGKANRNRDAFLEEDLKAAVEERLFAAPYFGMVDYNHDFNLYGVWYQTKFAYDPSAEAYGIVAEGAIFAWRFEELADKMLAMQARQGFIDVSMACLPGSVEFAEDDLGTYAILRNPVFFTTSVLDVDPADPKARALGTEDTDELPGEREVDLLTLSSATDLEPVGSNDPKMEDTMDLEKIVAALREVVAEDNQARMEPLVEAAQRLPVVEGELEDTKAALATATEASAALQASVEELTTARDEAVLAANTAKAELEAQTEELEALRQYKAEVEAQEAAARRDAIREARLAELSEAARAEFDALEEEVRERLLTRWEDDAEWQVARVALVSAAKRNKYEQASDKEGRLAPGAGEQDAPRNQIDKFIK